MIGPDPEQLAEDYWNLGDTTMTSGDNYRGYDPECYACLKNVEHDQHIRIVAADAPTRFVTPTPPELDFLRSLEQLVQQQHGLMRQGAVVDFLAIKSAINQRIVGLLEAKGQAKLDNDADSNNQYNATR